MSNPAYAEITAQIIEQLKNGAIPWVKPWKSGTPQSHLDRNIVSGTPYRGINRIILGMSFRSNPAWATYKQWSDLGGNVKKGEKGTRIVFFKPVAAGVDANGDKTNGYAVLKTYSVFNADQVEGLTVETPIDTTGTLFDANLHAEQTLINSGAIISHGGDRAFYMPSSDRIQLPNKTEFTEPAGYYATAFHELTHWTSEKTRCDRDLSKGRFGNSEYAFEELVAELGSAFLCQDHGIQGELRHAGYIESWIRVLTDHDNAIFKAAALAQKSADFINKSKVTEDQLAA